MSKLFYDTTITTTEDTTEGVLCNICVVHLLGNLCSDGTATDDNLSANVLAVSRSVRTLYHTQLTATIDITLDSATSDCQFGTLHITQFPPVNSRNSRFAIQLIQSSHTTCKDVTALGVGQSAIRLVIFGIRNMVRILPTGPVRSSPTAKGISTDRTISCRNDKLIRITDSTARDGDVNVTAPLIKESAISSTIVELMIFTNLAIASYTCIIQTVAHRT